jgi:hypothetical protein
MLDERRAVGMPSRNTEDGKGVTNCMLPRVQRNNRSGMVLNKIVATFHMLDDSRMEFHNIVATSRNIKHLYIFFLLKKKF